MFTSDFGIVAEYFVQKRTQPNYKPSPRKLKHVRETLELLSVMGGKHKFIDTYNIFYKKGNLATEGGSYTMSDFIDKMLDEAENRGVAEGRAEGRELGMRELARKLRLRGDSVEDIANLVGYSPEIVNVWLTSDTVETAPTT